MRNNNNNFPAVVGCRRNKLRNAAGLIGLFFLDMNTELLELRVLVAVEDIKISFICKSSVYFRAPHFQLVPLYYVCSGDGTVFTA